MAHLIFLVGLFVVIYAVSKGFKLAYTPPTVAVNSGNPAKTIQV